MSEQVIIEAVNDSRDWESPDGKIKNTFYTVVVKKGDGTEEEVDHARVTGGAEPQAGEELEVYFEPGKFRRRMKKAKTGAFAQSSPESSSQSSGGQDVSVKRMSRAHAQEMALIELRQAAAVVDGQFTPQFLKLCDLFEDDVAKAGQKASEGPASGAEGGAVTQPSTPAIHEAAPPSPPADEDKQEFADALHGVNAGDSDQVRWLTNAWAGIPESSRRLKALGGLRAADQQMVDKTLAGLWKVAGTMPDSFKTEGIEQDLPAEKVAGATEDDLPF